MAPAPKRLVVAEEAALFPNRPPEAGADVAGVVLAPPNRLGPPAAGVVDVLLVLFPNKPPAGVVLPPAVLDAPPKSEGVVVVVLAPNSPPGFGASVVLAPNKLLAGVVELAAGVPKAEAPPPKIPPDVAVVDGWPEAALELGVPKSPDMATIM